MLFKAWYLMNNRIIRFNNVSMNIMIYWWFRDIRCRKLFLLHLSHSVFRGIQNAIIRLLKKRLGDKLCLSNFHRVLIICEWIIRQLILIVIEIYDSSEFLLSLHHFHQSFILIWLKFFMHDLECITDSIILSFQSSKTC